jgi:hypothetical protein
MALIVGYDISLPVAQNYAGLQASVKNWLNRSDLAALVPEFITLVEEKLNRSLRVRQMESALAPIDTTNGLIPVPAGTVGVKSLWVDGLNAWPLHSQALDFVKSRPATGTPSVYAWQGGNFIFDGNATIAGVLYQRIPALSATNLSNWLLTEAPSAYLFGAMREAFDYVRDDGERDRWAARFEQVILELNGADSRDRLAGSLQVRVG